MCLHIVLISKNVPCITWHSIWNVLVRRVSDIQKNRFTFSIISRHWDGSCSLISYWWNTGFMKWLICPSDARIHGVNSHDIVPIIAVLSGVSIHRSLSDYKNYSSKSHGHNHRRCCLILYILAFTRLMATSLSKVYLTYVWSTCV